MNNIQKYLRATEIVQKSCYQCCKEECYGRNQTRMLLEGKTIQHILERESTKTKNYRVLKQKEIE